MQAGALNRRITIKQLAAGQDAIGQPLQTWSDVATVWANVLHKSGAESIKAEQEVSIVRASIRIRRRAGITAAMRCHLGAVVYEIKAVLPDEQDRERIDLACELING
ncbi:phage head closure protein [Methylibium sp.]|uniref:phage head closure protein n=1 Tax=Methylibium sp. TaxID=2067992 RepID=UPI0017B696AB|nr:phage head closure protein [Methylibium sp.]MBA3588299.1 phage head closure protein [Methylibium sp.]